MKKDIFRVLFIVSFFLLLSIMLVYAANEELKITVVDAYGNPMEGERVDVYIAGTANLSCRNTSISSGVVNCTLDDSFTYDIMLFNISVAGEGMSNATVKRSIPVPFNITVSPIVTNVIIQSPPTIVNFRGKLTDPSGVTVNTGSMSIEIIDDESGNVRWSNTFNDIFNSKGVFYLDFGALKAMYLTKDDVYKIVARIDVGAATYSSADVTFGDGNPSKDLIKFVP